MSPTGSTTRATGGWYRASLVVQSVTFGGVGRYTSGSMTTPRAPRGTRDLLPPERPTWERLERLASDLAGRYGYRQITTPMFEQADVFERGVGAVTDIVEKELFRIVPRTEESESWALRPEPTAGIVRAYIQHGMQTWPQPVKLSQTGAMFRYDRPQAGRYRQFWQFDVEAIGDAGPAVDAEIIELGLRYYRDAGLDGVEVHLNSIGDPVCRPAYVDLLSAYYAGHRDALPALERGRLERNVLRLLDSKDPAMTALNAAAPKITDHLCDACAAHFAGVRAHLDALGLSYRLEPGLVRGLDYYTRTAFEFYVVGREGQQQALGGGGRYDGLVELLGGRPTPGIGFGIGIDRLILALSETEAAAVPEPTPAAVVVGADPDDTAGRLRVATDLRTAGIAARAELGRRKLGKQLEAAARDQAHFAVILGDELATGEVGLRDLPAGTQKLVGIGDLAREIGRAHAAHRHGPAERSRGE
jgi:histidyl-tRNA synthetase